MRSRWGTAVLLTGILFFGTGASVEGIRQARQWKLAAEVAEANGQLVEAHIFYRRLAETFPKTPHGRLGACRAKSVNERLLWPERSPAAETPSGWLGELIDLVTWP